MAVTLVSGNRATAATQGIQAARRIIDMSDRILLLEPNAAPLTTLLQRLDKDSVFNPEFKVLKDELRPTVDAINSSSGYTAGDTTLKVDNDPYFEAGQIIYNPRTDERMRVTGKSATDDTIDVSRSWGSTAAAAINDNDPLYILSDAAVENADVGSSVTTQATSDTNYTQIFRTPFGLSGTLMASDLYGGDDMAYQARKVGIEHVRKLNLASWFSEKAEVTSGSTPRRTTGGVHEWIGSTNVTDVAGSLTSLEMEAFARSVFRYGESTTRNMFVSREVASAFSLLALNNVETVPEDTSFGISIQRWLSPHGVINLIVENLFSDADYTKERGYLLDMSQLGYRFLQGRDTMLRTNVQSPGRDGRIDEYLTEFGVLRGQNQSSGLLKGVTLGS